MSHRFDRIQLVYYDYMLQLWKVASAKAAFSQAAAPATLPKVEPFGDFIKDFHGWCPSETYIRGLFVDAWESNLTFYNLYFNTFCGRFLRCVHAYN